MTFQEMYDQGRAFGISDADMLKNAEAQEAQYRRLSRTSGDMWDLAANSAKEIQLWLQNKG